MYNIKWFASCTYNDAVYKYSVFAPSKFIAENIVKKLVECELDITEGYDLSVSVYELTQSDFNKVIKARESIFHALKEEFTNLSYKDFVSKIKVFDAFDIEFADNKIHSFKLIFMGLHLEVVYSDNTSIISTSNIIYNSSSGAKILILNNWKDFYYIS